MVSSSIPESGKQQRVLFGSILLFAFLLASFPARNLDFWVHLADGRDLVQGLIRPGPGFLFDLMAWAGTISFGPSLMVLFKALLVAAMARNLWKIIGPDFPWIAAMGTGLAVLAMSNRLLMQPLVISLFLGSVVMIRIWAQTRPLPFPGFSTLLLMAVWAMVDPSFWMAGVVLLALSIGEILDGFFQGRSTLSGWGWFLWSLVAVGIWVFIEVISGEGIANALSQWAGPDGWYRSPFANEYLGQALNSPAGLAFFPLVFLSAVGILMDLPGFRWSRVLPWAVTGVAACLNFRLIPWFALFAGPIFAIGISNHFRMDPVANESGHGSWKLSPLGRRGLTFSGWVVLFSFLIAAWPGWLQLPPYGPRSWRYDPHPSWERVGTRIASFQAFGWLPKQTSVALSSRPMARALSWFHPAIQWIPNSNLSQQDRKDPGADLVLALDNDHFRWLQVAQKYWVMGPAWQPVEVEGAYVLFAKNQLVNKGLPVWNPDRIAMLRENPISEEEDFRDSPIPEDTEGQWFRSFYRSTPAWKPWRDQAELLLLESEFQRQRAPGKAMRAWITLQSAGLVSGGFTWTPGGPPLDALLRIQMLGPFRAGTFDPGTMTKTEAWVLSLQEFYGNFYGEISPATLYMALRALRQESLASPGDGLTRKLLGETYQRLLFNSRERSWGRNVAGLAQLRRVQAARALSESVRISPGSPEARFSLGMHFQDLGYRDLALEELRRHHELIAAMALPRGADPIAFLRDIRENGKKLDRMEEDLGKRLESLTKESAGLRVFERAQMAMDLGLAGWALNTLLGSDVSAFGLPGMQMEIQLLLFTGGAKQVRDWSGTEALDNQDKQGFHWTRIQAFGALGQFGSARKECDSISFPLDIEGKGAPRVLGGLVIGQAVLDGLDPQPNMVKLVNQVFNRQRTQGRLDGLGQDLRAEAEGLALAGLFAIEEGRIGVAQRYFEQALSIKGKDGPVSNWDFESRPMTEGLLEMIRQANQ